MYGKHFESMYEGSMVGAGSHVFAVMGYIISKTRFGVVELNPKLLSAILGDSLERVISAIEYLCAPDPGSRNPDEDGRRLVKTGAFSYRVVSWEKYQAIRDEIDRRIQNREAQQRFRDKNQKSVSKKRRTPLKGTSGPLPGETAYVRASENGVDPDTLAKMVDRHL